MANLRIKLVKSLNGRLDSHIATAQSLGLHKIGNETVQPDNPQTRGKIAKIGYLLKVTEEAPRMSISARAEDMEPETARQPAAVTRVRRPAAAAVCGSDSKAVRCLWPAVSRSADSTIFLQSLWRQSTFPLLTSLKTVKLSMPQRCLRRESFPSAATA